jgi:lysine 2,3-aminomutase
MSQNIQLNEGAAGPKQHKTTNSDDGTWKWQTQNALKSLADFEKFFDLTENERSAFSLNTNLFQIRATPYYAGLADKSDPNCPIRKIIVPQKKEVEAYKTQSLKDPLAERKNNPVGRVIHRYEDRALLLVTDFCSVYCRYCTRKHFTASGASMISEIELTKALGYIAAHPEIKEVILSGGDPLTLSNKKLDFILSKIKLIPSVEIIRIGSRVPTVMPMRVDLELVQILKKHKPVFFMSHFNHKKEITEQSAKALELFVDHGIPVMNQMVLLKGVNDSAEAVRGLSRTLLRHRVKPYYMFQCDPVVGTEHLKVPLEKSRQIQKELWGRTSGLAMPNLSLDIPDGGGKVGIVPDFYKGSNKGSHYFTGFDGIEGVYEDPV